MRRDRRSAFTLLELVAVLVLMVVLSIAVAISLQGNLRAAQLENALDRVQAFDGRARQAARGKQVFVRLTIDADAGRMRLEPVANETAFPPRELQLARGLRIQQLRTGRSAANDGRLQVSISPLGQSESFAIELSTIEGRRVWLVVLGGSGQVVRISDEQQVQQILAPANRDNVG